MKRVAGLCVILILLGLFMGCAGTKPGRPTMEGVPEWVIRPPQFADAYAAVGISSPGLSDAMARTQAETRGRRKLASILETRIAAMTRDWLQASSSFINEEATISERQFTEDVSKSLTKVTLVGAYVKEYFVRDDGTVYALVVLPKENVLEQARNTLIDKANKDALINRYYMEQAQKTLDEAIEKEYKALQGLEE